MNYKNRTLGEPICWFCGHRLVWQSDFNYDEIFGDGDGIVSYLKCNNCGADVEFSLKD